MTWRLKPMTRNWNVTFTWLPAGERNATLGTAVLASGGIGAYAQPASKPPNIIFILADDLGYADVSCYGRRDFTTPNIDRIAARGMRFLQGTPIPPSAPPRVSR